MKKIQKIIKKYFLVFTSNKLKLLLLLFFLSISSVFGQVKKLGLPEIKNYKRTDYHGGTQNWDIDQDKEGNVYFANNNGLFQFDGTTWHKYSLPNLSVIRAVKIQDSGKIFVSGYNEFGYFNADSNGRLIYYSLSKFLNTQNDNTENTIDIVWKIHFYKEEVIFQSFGSIFIFKNNSIKTIKAPTKFHFSFKVKDRLYFQDIKYGLLEYKNNKLATMPGSTFLNNTQVWGMFNLTNTKVLIATLDKGLFTCENGIFKPWNSEANDFTIKNSCLGGVMIKNNHIVLNSVRNGIIVCDSNGKIIQLINLKKGLQNNTVLSSFVDNKNNLWLGLDNGITFINENSPFSYFGFSYDISTVYASVIYKENLYVATNQGVFYHNWGTPFIDEPFALVEGTTGQAYNVQVIDGQLICSHNKGALIIDGVKLTKIVDNVGYWVFKKIPGYPNYMIGSNYNGFSLFIKGANGWQFSHQIEGFYKSVGEFEIDIKNIWVKKDDLLYKIALNPGFKNFKDIKTYLNLSNTDNGFFTIQKLKNSICFKTENNFYKYSENSNVFYKDEFTSKLFESLLSATSIREDQYQNIWYAKKSGLGVLMKNNKGNYTKIESPFYNLTQDLVLNNLSVNTVNPENIFLGFTQGLAHYNSKASKEFMAKPQVYIRSFSSNKDTLFYGNGKIITDKYKIKYSANQVKFTFASPTFENIDNIKYSYLLDGFEDKWSNWSSLYIKEYTNLKEGNYTMRVKVVNSFGITSDETSFSFKISPPWYRHFLAYLFYIITLTTIFYYIRIRIKSKIRKNKYYQTVEQRRLYLEKESKIRQEQFDLEKEIEKLQNEKLKVKILAKDKELVTNSLQIAKKNKILNGIIQKLKDINVDSFDESAKFQLSKLNKSIVKEVNADHSWKDLEKHIKNVHYDFLKRLKELCPSISPRELDLSTYLLMNMSTKEIAEIMNISNGGVELARYRLRKKLGLNNKENLTSYLISI
ncbi:LuxR C-terminal-related transcriptional regulator [Flavobacterium sp.]|uniref:helix-turn-helix and ligand-binding sensor domain-containing protein n=1 Tax=Flavobacterium sp. TaxID=239 RepID=UPI0038FCB591